MQRMSCGSMALSLMLASCAVFAAAEPPSHDDWRPTVMNLAPYARNPVRQALRQIKDRFHRRTTPVTGTRAPATGQAVDQ